MWPDPEYSIYLCRFYIKPVDVKIHLKRVGLVSVLANHTFGKDIILLSAEE